MVINYSKKYNYFLKRRLFFVVIIVTTIFLLGVVPTSEAKTINNTEIREIKTFLEFSNVPFFSNYSEEQIKKLLNLKIGIVKVPDFTYGLLVLNAKNDIEFMDMILSQDYKKKQKEYFNSVLDRKLDLISHFKKTGQNIYSLISKGTSVGPLTGPAMESTEIINKTIEIFISFNALKETKKYDGLWYYFDLRKKGNESHEIAWNEAKIVMGFDVKPQFSFRGLKVNENNNNELEAQFAALWDKWGPYVTPYGISEEYKEQVRDELNDTLVFALNTNTFIEEEPRSSLVEKAANQLNDIKNFVANLVSRVNPFQAGQVVELPKEKKEKDDTDKVKEEKKEKEEKPKPTIEDLQEDLDDILEEIDIVEQDISEKIVEAEPEEVLEEEITEKEEIIETEDVEAVEPEEEIEVVLAGIDESSCQRNTSDMPLRYRVRINEIAWMGTGNSSDDEWIELKNVWGIPISLDGWQLLDKDGQIKIVFGEDDILYPNSHYLLERTDDDSVPNVEADFIYSGSLNDTNEILYLFDNNCKLEDVVDALSGWEAGYQTQKRSMQRFDNFYWYTYGGFDNNGVLGTPKEENSSPPTEFSKSSSVSEIEEPLPKIRITEVQVKTADSTTHDFIELYNPEGSLNISGWQLKKKNSAGNVSSIRVFPEGTSVNSHDYFIWANSEYSASGLISADATSTNTLAKKNSIALFNNEGVLIDSLAWEISINPYVEGEFFPETPEAGESLGRRWFTKDKNYMDSDNNQSDFRIQTPTPGAKNESQTPGSYTGRGQSPDIVINEIAWAGTAFNAADEWIELYSSTSSVADLSGWRLVSDDPDGIDITFSNLTAATTTIEGFGYYLIERTDDDTISDVTAGWTGSFGNGLSNTVCEVLSLYDINETLIDSTACYNNNWPGGEAGPNYISMERISTSIASGTDIDNWRSNNQIDKNGLDAIGNPINGTPKAENSASKAFTEISGVLNIDEDFTLTLQSSPYIVEGSIVVGAAAKLTIEPGVVIKFKHHNTWHSELRIDGELEAIGGEAPSEKIVFTSYKDDTYGGDTNGDGSSTQPEAGDWEWLYLNNAQSVLTNIIVKYAGQQQGNPPENPLSTKGAVYIDGGQAVINNLAVEETETLGVWIKNSSLSSITSSEFTEIDTAWVKPAAVYIESSDPTISASTFNNNNIGILVENFASPTIENNIFSGNQVPIQISTLLPTISGSIVSNNNYNGIYLTGLSFPEGVTTMTWKETDIPYIIDTLTLASGLTINVEAGVIVKFLNNSRLNIEGNFETFGKSNNKIVFTSIQDDEYGGDTNNDGVLTQPVAGRWDYIYFAPSSVDPILKYVIVRYGGWYNVAAGGPLAKSGAIKADSALLSLEYSVVENSLYAGLYLISSASGIQNTVFQNNTAEYAFGLYSSGLLIKDSAPDITSTDFNSNYYGVFVESGDCPDLSGADFGTGDDANSVDIYPPSCTP